MITFLAQNFKKAKPCLTYQKIVRVALGDMYRKFERALIGVVAKFRTNKHFLPYSGWLCLQMPQPGGQPLQQQMAGFTQPMPRPSPGISPALNQSGQFPQFRPGITPPFQPGMVPRSGMSHSPQPFPTASAFQPPSAVNGVRPNPNLVSLAFVCMRCRHILKGFMLVSPVQI